MKRKGLLFSMLSVICVSLITGCGETTYDIKVNTSSNERGSVSGGGSYTMGSEVNINIYPNKACSPTYLTFVKGEESSDITNLTKVGDNHYKYTFVVKEETIGTYTVHYECESREANSTTTTMKHHVNYFVYDASEGKYLSLKSIEVPDGGTAENIEYYENKGKYIWYTDSNCTKNLSCQTGTEYKFTTKITKDLDLYSTINIRDSNKLVEDAINKFKNSSYLQVSENTPAYNENELQSLISTGDSAKILNLDKGYDKMNMSVNTSKTTSAYILDKNFYYDQTGASGTKKIKLEGSNFEFKDITHMYKFVNIIDNSEGYDFQKVTDKTIKSGIMCGVEQTCDIYKGTKAEQESLIVYIYNGTLYGFGFENENIQVVEYLKTLTSAGTANNKDTYFVKLFSDDEAFNEKLESINSNFEEIVTITPNIGETLENVIKEKLANKNIKAYSYTLNKYVSSTGQCSNNSFDLTSSITSNLEVCLKVQSAITKVQDAVKELENGGFTLTSTIKVFGEDTTKSFTVNATENSDALTDKPTGINDIQWGMIEKLKDVMADKYDSFKYDETTQLYSLYDSNETKVAFIAVKLNETDATKIDTVLYFDGENTYTTTFTYNG